MKKSFPDGSFIQIDDSIDGPIDEAVVSMGGMKGKILTTLTMRLKKKELREMLNLIDEEIARP